MPTLLTFEVAVDAVVKECAWAEVDQSDVVQLHVDKNVLVLDVSMHDAGVVQRRDRPHDLPEEAARLVLLQAAALGDVVEQVLDALRPLHHHDEAVRLLEVVDQSDHAQHAWCTLEQTDLDRQPPSAFLYNIATTMSNYQHDEIASSWSLLIWPCHSHG